MYAQVSSLIYGAQLGMAAGESPVTLVTSNVQVIVTSSLITAVGNSVLTTPASASQLAYGYIQPKIIMGSAGLSGCRTSGGYVQLSVLKWGQNPYAESKTVKSPLIRFSSTFQASLKSPKVGSESVDYISFSLPGVPAYYVALQFSSIQDFNFTASLHNTGTSRSASNFTLPACTQYNGFKYVPCKSCNISTYTNYNVTYSCFDITQLCPPSSVQRYLQESEYESTGTFLLEEDDEDEDGEEEQVEERFDGAQGEDDFGSILSQELPSRSSSTLKSRLRSLKGDDDQATAPSSASTYGMLLESVLGELTSVLSSNPFALDLAQSTTVLSFIGSLSGFILVVLLYLLRLDCNEKLDKVYVRRERDTVARKLLESDLKNGGKGDIDASYQLHIKVIHHEDKTEKSIASTIRRQSVLLGGKSPRGRSSVIEVNQDDDCENDPTSHNDPIDDIAARNHHKVTALIMEFLHRLFPGRSIFVKKRNIMKILSLNHDYCKMFSSSSMTHTRTIRFLNLVCVVLVAIFIDTVFFGIYFPPPATCTVLTDKVMRYDYMYHATYHIKKNNMLCICAYVMIK